MKRLRFRRIVAVAAAIAITIYSLSGCWNREVLEEPVNADFAHATIEETELFNQGGLVIKANGLNLLSEDGPSLRLHIDNKAAKAYTIKAQRVSVNGFMSYPELEVTVEQGGTGNKTMRFDAKPLIAAGVKTFAEVRMSFKLSDVNGNTYDTKEALIKTSRYEQYTQEYNFGGETFAEGGGVVVKAGKVESEGVYLYAENNTKEIIYLETKDVKANGIDMAHYFIREIAPGMKLCAPVEFRDADMVANGIVALDALAMGFTATSSYGVLVDSEAVEVGF